MVKTPPINHQQIPGTLSKKQEVNANESVGIYNSEQKILDGRFTVTKLPDKTT